MRPARMQLKEYFVAESFFRLQPKYSTTVANKDDFRLSPSDLTIKVALGEHSENANEKICELTIMLKDETEQTFPYVFRTVMLGFFDLDQSCEPDEAELLLKTNAPSVLYSAAREFLLLTTGRSMFTPLMLPTVTFLPVPVEKSAKTIKGESKTKRQSAKTSLPKTAKKQKD